MRRKKDVFAWMKVMLMVPIFMLAVINCTVGAAQHENESPVKEPSDDNSGSISYPIVDTGQVKCFNNSREITPPQKEEAFYGQDAQYNGHQPGYTLSGDGLTVYDNVTGLTWTKSPDLDGDGDIDVYDKLSFNEAQVYPNTLNAQNYGGYNDWRLPTMKELYSLMNFSGTDPMGPGTTGLTPFIDTDYFDFAYGDTGAGERNIDAQFWSSNAYVGTVFDNRSAAFGLNLADGRIKGYPSAGPVGKINYVYFVRGNTGYGLNDFNDNGDGTISDNATGLMWSKDDSGSSGNTEPRSGMTWEEALSWVQQKNNERYLGYSDWRLPNAKEMQSIVDYSRAPDATGSAAIDPVFNITEIINEKGEVDYPWFWTGTTHKAANGMGRAAVYISFGRAMGYMRGQWMDVHGAGAQRTDPKSGDQVNYPHGRGPQGDAVRVYNYVRCVRGGAAEPRTTGPKVEMTRKFDHFRNRMQSPLFQDRRRGQFPSGDHFVRRLDKDGDGKVSRAEFDGPKEHFDYFDKDGDGFISTEESPKGPPGRQRHKRF